MSRDEDVVRLRHMLDAAQKAVEFTRGCNSDDLKKDDKLALSIVRLLEIVGEAAKNVSDRSWTKDERRATNHPRDR